MTAREERIGRAVFGEAYPIDAWDDTPTDNRERYVRAGQAAIATLNWDVEQTAEAMLDVVEQVDSWITCGSVQREAYRASARAAIRVIRGTKLLRRDPIAQTALVQRDSGYVARVQYRDERGAVVMRDVPVSVEIPEEIEA